MEYNRIISVTGLGGLFELVGSKADGAIVRSLEDKTTKFVSSRSHHFSHLESIEVYTLRENVNLIDVFKVMKTSDEKIPDYKNAQAVKDYFSVVYPEMDMERVYGSDMKKMVRWYNILIANEISLDEVPDETPAEAVEVTEEKSTAGEKKTEEKKESPKKATKKAAAKKDSSEKATDKPKKKAAPKSNKKDAE